MISKCDICGSYTHEHDTEEQHGWVPGGDCTPCPKMSENQIKKNMIVYFREYQKTYHTIKEAADRNQIYRNKAKKDRDIWHGKYMIVKHENNQLRKKLR